jgi:hypoxanthine phosphoribosyltransferase
VVLDNNKKYLVVDDLVDSWKTIELIKKKYWSCCRKLDIATLYHKGKTTTPNYFIKKMSRSERIEFYYEKNIDE